MSAMPRCDECEIRARCRELIAADFTADCIFWSSPVWSDFPVSENGAYQALGIRRLQLTLIEVVHFETNCMGTGVYD